MSFMLRWRYNQIKQLVKLVIKKKISFEQYSQELEKLQNEIYFLNNLN